MDSSSSSDDTSIFSGEESRETSSSSSSSPAMSSGSSGEIPETVVRISGESPENLRDKCVGRNDKVSYGFTSVIGRRAEMEDAVAVVPGFVSRTCAHVGGCTAPSSRTSNQLSPIHFFGVFDGHGGTEVADYCAEKMHEVIAEELNREITDGSEWQNKWKEAFSSGFKRADDQVVSEARASEMVGSTAVVAVVSGCQIILSNCGDSRAVLCRRTQTIPLTVDHKPDRADELSRIEGEGGRVINWHGARVLGVLAMSRAIGDRYMSPFIIPVPEVTFMTRSDEDECLILASDGLWDVMSNEEVSEVARRILRRMRRMVSGDTSPAQAVADNLRQRALSKNSPDNISIIVVDLKSRRRHQARQ
ncbi:protein phosphatase 2C 56 [Beta vulgaris subsp. vulgaris]|uniref:protein phosphatase 2C 56 n=1 Tax=Beta vulgaris subsp. vulgaris TaxID=3555 RepID=UPI0020368878|nr:protein phosphatase 2C 56 [Beta vulgaris subsp. vulgaris]